MSVSITIRPREYTRNMYDLTLGWLKKQNTDFVISEEKGNHLQVCVASEKRTNNIRRAITSLLKFKPSDEAEKQYWLKISSHDDWKYLVGYCLKEQVRFDYQLSEDITVYTSYYKDKKETIGNNDWICTSINSLPWKAYEFMKEQNSEYSGRNIKFKSVVVDMFRRGLIPFSLARKIRKEDEIFWSSLWSSHWNISEIDREVCRDM